MYLVGIRRLHAINDGLADVDIGGIVGGVVAVVQRYAAAPVGRIAPVAHAADPLRRGGGQRRRRGAAQRDRAGQHGQLRDAAPTCTRRCTAATSEFGYHLDALERVVEDHAVNMIHSQPLF
ncbi:hypothetical protein D3C71_1681910 [compost metagenome]